MLYVIKYYSVIAWKGKVISKKIDGGISRNEEQFAEQNRRESSGGDLGPVAEHFGGQTGRGLEFTGEVCLG